MSHGIKVNELTTGTRAIKAVSTSVIGLVATASAAVGAETTALNAAFPVDTPVLVTDVRKAIEAAGTGGTLKAALAAIADQTNPQVVVTRAAIASSGSQDDLTEVAVNKLLGAESALGVRPRILGAPGLDSQDIATALAATARKLRGMAYAMAVGNDISAAVDYRENFGARELMLFWPGFSAGGADTVARALGLRSRIDQEIGWHKTLSNVAVDGVTGLLKPVYFDITNSAGTDAALLNDADITTMIRHDGFRFWGNRTCSDEPLFAFESTVRTAQVLQDTIAAGLLWAIDKPLTDVLVKDIIETINALFRQLVGAGYLIGAKAWYDPSLNSTSALAAGKLVIDYDFTPVAPLEDLGLNQRITDRYYASFADQIG